MTSLSRTSCERGDLSGRVMGCSGSGRAASIGDDAALRTGSCGGFLCWPPTVAGGGAGGTRSSSSSVHEASEGAAAEAAEAELSAPLAAAGACLEPTLDSEPLLLEAADRCEACDLTEEPLARREQLCESAGGASMPQLARREAA